MIKKILLPVALSFGLMSLAAPAQAVVTAPITSGTCTITVPAELSRSDTRVIDDRDIKLPLTAVSCPAGVTLDWDYYEEAKTDVDSSGEWSLSNYFQGNNYDRAYLYSSKVTHDPFGGGIWNSCYGCDGGYLDFEEYDSVNEVHYIGLGWGNVGTWNFSTDPEQIAYLVHTDGITTEFYNLALSNPIAVKYETTVSLKAKKIGSKIKLTVKTSRNNEFEMASGLGSYRVAKAYPGDKVSIYRNGKKIATKKLSASGKLTFYVKAGSGKHTYKAVLPAVDINHKGSATVRK